MPYSKKNYYRRIIEIQDLTQHYQRIGLTNRRIFNEHIKDHYFICERTFTEYLGIPAKRDLRKLLDAEKLQYKLFNEEDDV